MPRKGLVFPGEPKRPIRSMPATLWRSFICSMMWGRQKKSTAQRVFYGAMDQVAKKTNDDALKNFQEGHREREAVAGSQDAARGAARTTRFPVEVNPFRQAESLAIRWLLQYSRERRGARPMVGQTRGMS